MTEKKFTYYVSLRLDDSACYSIRCRRKRDLIQALKNQGAEEIKNPYNSAKYIQHTECGDLLWGTIKKVTITFSDTMDLVEKCLGEFSAPWEF